MGVQSSIHQKIMHENQETAMSVQIVISYSNPLFNIISVHNMRPESP